MTEEVKERIDLDHYSYDQWSPNDNKGLYAISIDDIKNIQLFNKLEEHECIFECAENSKRKNLLYIGKGINIYKRLWDQDLQGKGPAIFFRKIGSVLGFKSAKKGDKFSFSTEDKDRIQAWNEKHLRIQAFKGEDAYRHEYDLIEYFKPAFNAKDGHTGCLGVNKLLSKNK